MIVGRQLATSHMRSSLVCEAINNAQKNRGCLHELFHLVRGSQSVYKEVETKLKMLNISMNRKGSCWDNAVAESFFGTLKKNT